jgi:sulfur carrier protein ThiS
MKNVSGAEERLSPSLPWVWKENERDMKVRVRLVGTSELPPSFQGQKEAQVSFPGSSVKDLIHHLASGAGSEMSGIFLDEKGDVSSDLVIIVGGIAVTDSNRANLRLKEGDLVELVSSPG